MANIQPTRSSGGGTEGVKTVMSYRSLLDIKTLLFFKAKIWSAGEERSCRGRHGAVRFAVPACERVRTVTPALCLSAKLPRRASSLLWLTFWEGSSVVIQEFAVSLLLLPGVHGTQPSPSQVQAAVVTWSSWQLPDSDAAHRGLPGATGRGIVSYPLSFPVYRNW